MGKMKIKPIFEEILLEIGDSKRLPSGATFLIGEHGGNSQFKFLEDNYKVEIRVPIIHKNRIAISVDFYTTDESKRFRPGDYNLTNKNQPLKVMSFIVGVIEEWLNRFRITILNNESLELSYIKFDPKSEEDEIFGVSENKRFRLYKIFIEKFANKHNTNVTFLTSGGVTAIFKPELVIT